MPSINGNYHMANGADYRFVAKVLRGCLLRSRRWNNTESKCAEQVKYNRAKASLQSRHSA